MRAKSETGCQAEPRTYLSNPGFPMLPVLITLSFAFQEFFFKTKAFKVLKV